MNQEDTKQDISLAVLSRDIHHLTNSMSEMKNQFATVISNYVTREELKAAVDSQIKLHDDIERRLRRQEDVNSDFNSKIAKLSTEIKVWLTVGAFIIGAVEAVIMAVIIKAI